MLWIGFFVFSLLLQSMRLKANTVRGFEIDGDLNSLTLVLVLLGALVMGIAFITPVPSRRRNRR